MKDLRASTIIAGLALFVLIGGTATAASGLINGKKIKKGTVTAKQIKNKTITTAKLSPSTVTSLKGQNGTPGPAGATGATGPEGAAGSDGIVTPLVAEAQDVQLDAATPALVSLDLPAGEYMLSAKLNVTSHDADAFVNCSIWVDGTAAADEAVADPVAFNETVPMSLMAVTEVGETVDLRCNSFDLDGNADDVKLIAVPVGS